MCGIAGLLTVGGAAPERLDAATRAMADSLESRGPDGSGFWSDPAAGLAFGHRRLAIVDPSGAGDQPMASADGRWVLCYNGEVYNAREIAQDLPNVAWRGHSDTEVVLEACARWGVRAALPRFAGMFAFALWDRRERALWLVRDRLGIKPLYWAWQGGTLFFGSQPKALMAVPGFEARADPSAVAGYLRHGYVPAPASILAGVAKLQPGHLLRLAAGEAPQVECWWSLAEAAAAPRFAGTAEDATERLEELLDRVVGEHLISDVPLGAFLSGGIDSSLVVSSMARVASGPVHTFSIGFRESAFDEAAAARAVAEHLGTSHTELTVEPAHAQAAIARLGAVYDEPFADSSQVPTLLVSELARRSVTVALSGDGGDEGFAGYTRHTALERLWRLCGGVPAGARRLAAAGLRSLSPDAWDRISRLLPESRRPRMAGDKLHKAAGILGASSVAAMYRGVTSQWQHPDALTEAPEVAGAWEALAEGAPAETIDALRLWDMAGYLPDDILTKLDRASMAVGLEARVPLLDHRIVEFAWSLPPHLLIRAGRGKQPLRRVLAGRVPPALTERAKMGFALPIGAWLRGPLRDWAEELLTERALEETGLVRAAPVRACWEAHLAGRGNLEHPLWTVLMLQTWAARWRVRA